MTADPPRPAAALPATLHPAAPPAADPPPRAVKAEPGDLVVRRPQGSYTREVPRVGKVTLTFADGRLTGVADIRLDEVAFVMTFDADYAMNAESVVFGVISSADVQGGFDDETVADVARAARAASDLPFAFRGRVEDDSVTVKDVRFGALGSPAFELVASKYLGRADGSIDAPTAFLSGKYRADPNPTRPAPPPPVPPARRTTTTPRLAYPAAQPLIIGPPTGPSQPTQPGLPSPGLPPPGGRLPAPHIPGAVPN
jgi:hypothetical protein